jgi:hypothetical protein
MRRRIGRGFAVIVLTLAIAWVLGHVHWPERVGLTISALSGRLGGRGIEDTEDLFLVLSFVVAFGAALAIVTLVGRRRATIRTTGIRN